MSLNCIVIDDELIARNLLSDYISKTPDLNLITTCSNPLEATTFISSGTIDLLFLDINMPNINGLDFLKSHDHLPAVILTTAYSEYAIESYDIGILDYLLKPIDFNRFYKAVNRALSQINPPNIDGSSLTKKSPTPTSNEETYLFVKSDSKMVKINYNDIIYITGKGAYVQIITNSNEKIMTLESMNKMEKILPPTLFFRVHRSHIINLSHVKSIEGNTLNMNNKVSISISKSKKEYFLKSIKSI